MGAIIYSSYEKVCIDFTLYCILICSLIVYLTNIVHDIILNALGKDKSSISVRKCMNTSMMIVTYLFYLTRTLASLSLTRLSQLVCLGMLWGRFVSPSDAYVCWYTLIIHLWTLFLSSFYKELKKKVIVYLIIIQLSEANTTESIMINFSPTPTYTGVTQKSWCVCLFVPLHLLNSWTDWAENFHGYIDWPG